MTTDLEWLLNKKEWLLDKKQWSLYEKKFALKILRGRYYSFRFYSAVANICKKI